MPASVSTRTSSMSMLVRARPPSIGVAPSITIGRLSTIVPTPVIFMASHYAPDRSILWPSQGGCHGTRDGTRTRRDLRARPGTDGRLLSRPHGHAGHQAELAGRHRLPEL